MEKYKFYVNKFEGTFHQPEICAISSDDIESFSLMAISLKPLSEVTEAAGYAAALEEHICSVAGPLRDKYQLLTQDSFGRMALCETIELLLLERHFRTSGITEKMAEAYNRLQKKHKQLIDYNVSANEPDLHPKEK